MDLSSSALLSLLGEGRKGALRCHWNKEIKITETTVSVPLLNASNHGCHSALFVSELLGYLKIKDQFICLKTLFSVSIIKKYTEAVNYVNMVKSLSLNILGSGILNIFLKVVKKTNKKTLSKKVKLRAVSDF